MPDRNYILRIAHRGSSEIEEQEHTRPADARTAFELLSAPDNADIYERVTLVEYDWRSHSEMVLEDASICD